MIILEECSICLEGGQPKVWTVLCCNHAFHQECLQMWLKESNSCPICRATLTRDTADTVIQVQEEETSSSVESSHSLRKIACILFYAAICIGVPVLSLMQR